MRRLIPLVVALALAAVLAAQAGAAAAAPSISITGTAVSDGVVTVKVAVSNFKLLPGSIGKKPNVAGAGHWHVFVDGTYNNASGAASGVTKKLSAGKHTIWVELANNDHSRLAPSVRSASVTVTVPAGTGAGSTVKGGAGTTTSSSSDTDMGGGMAGY